MKPAEVAARLKVEVAFLREENRELSLPAMKAMAERLNWLAEAVAGFTDLKSGLQTDTLDAMHLSKVREDLDRAGWSLRKLSKGLQERKPPIKLSHTYIGKVLKDPVLFTQELKLALYDMTGVKSLVER